MKTRRAYIVAISTALLLVQGCDQKFSPNGPYKEQMIIYAVFNTTTDTQYVRVYSTYWPSSVNPLSNTVDQQIYDAQVIVTQGTQKFIFSDTTVARKDTSRYLSPIHAYVCYTAHMEESRQYRLSVSSPSHGTVTASTQSMNSGTITITGSATLYTPLTSGVIELHARLGSLTRAYYIRFILYYEILVNGNWETQSVEIPLDYLNQNGQSVPLYPAPVYFASDAGSSNDAMVLFMTSAYIENLRQIKNRYMKGTYKFSKAEFHLMQMGDDVYAYYSTVNGFPGSTTVRLDEPDYTNITGGKGIFGIISETIASTQLPPDIPF